MLTTPPAPVSEARRRSFDALVSDKPLLRFVLGRNKYAASVAKRLAINGFIDDYTSQTEYLGKPVLRMGQLPSHSVVVSCVVDGRPITAMDRLEKAGVEHVIDYFSLLRLAPKQFLEVDYCENNVQDIEANSQHYAWLHQRLADDLSRSTLERITQFRRTLDLEQMRGFSLCLERQYFEHFVQFAAGEVFVDGGGFDGQTSQHFAARCPDYRQIIYFEPSPEMMAVSRRTLEKLRSITFLEKGLFDQSGEVQFDSTAGSASRIFESAETKISVVRLDEEVQEPVTFFKLDVEGSECAALKGASGHIQRSRPKIAVCVYHDQQDFWRVPTTILNLRNDYDVYLRHYTEGIMETVMYFTPAPDTGGQSHPVSRPPPV